MLTNFISQLPHAILMRRYLIFAVVTAALCGFPALASAQLPGIPLSVEIRAGAVVPLDDWAVPGHETVLRAGTGPLFEGALRLALPAGLSAYGSYHRGLPQCDGCSAFGLDDQMVDAGFGFGVGYTLPGILPVGLRVDAGGIAHQLAFQGGGETRPSDWGIGFEAGLTGSFGVAPSLFVEPALAGRAYTARYEFEEGDPREVEVQYVAPRIGLRYSF